MSVDYDLDINHGLIIDRKEWLIFYRFFPDNCCTSGMIWARDYGGETKGEGERERDGFEKGGMEGRQEN